MLAELAERLRRAGLPIVALSHVVRPEPAANTTYHAARGRTVRATWARPPARADLSALNKALNEGRAEGPTARYLRGLSPAARQDVVVRFLCYLADRDPALARALGVPPDDEADPAGPQGS